MSTEGRGISSASIAIRTVVAGPAVALEGAQDAEGIAKGPDGSVIVVDEGTKDLRAYDPTSGARLRVIAPPPIYAGRVKKNTGFESITAIPGGKGYWIATTEGSVITFGDARRLGMPPWMSGSTATFMVRP